MNKLELVKEPQEEAEIVNPEAQEVVQLFLIP